MRCVVPGTALQVFFKAYQEWLMGTGAYEWTTSPTAAASAEEQEAAAAIDARKASLMLALEAPPPGPSDGK